MNQSHVSFKFDLPEGWEDQTTYHFRGPSVGETEHTVTLIINRHLQHEEVSSFAKEWTNPLVSNLQGVEVLKDEEITIEHGNQAYEFVYRWTPADGIQMIMKYVFIIKDNLGYTFTCQFSKKTLKTVGVGMMDLIESLVQGTYEPLIDEDE